MHAVDGGGRPAPMPRRPEPEAGRRFFRLVDPDRPRLGEFRDRAAPVDRHRDQDGQFEMSADLVQPDKIHDFHDPDVGDTLEVVTVFPPARGVVHNQQFVDFEALKSVHGLVVRAINPGMKVAELLDILKITKQSLGRVLKQLIDQSYVVQKEGANDRRQRLLYVTAKGETLAMKLAGLQTARIAHALSELGPNAHEAACRFLTAMINADHRDSVLRFIAQADRARRGRG